MSMTFTKLFASITESSIWMQDNETRIVWIAMLAMADRRGRVWSSVPGMANRSRVPVESVERAISIFLAPDAYSRTKDNEGRRIAEIDGGWRLLNHQKYRDMRDDEARREQNREAQHHARAKVSKLADSQQLSANASAHAEAEAEAEAEAKRGDARARGASAEVPDLKQAAAMVMADGIPADFIALAHADWMDNGGCNALGIPKPWAAYVRTRWRKEAGDWKAGIHGGQRGKGKASPAPPWQVRKDLEAEERELAGRLHDYCDRERDPVGVARLATVRAKLANLKASQ